MEPGYRQILSIPPKEDGTISPPVEIPEARLVEESGESEKAAAPLTPVTRFNDDLKTVNSLLDTHKFMPLETKNQVAMEALQEQMEKNKAIANFVEVKYNTEQEIKNMLREAEGETDDQIQ